MTEPIFTSRRVIDVAMGTGAFANQQRMTTTPLPLRPGGSRRWSVDEHSGDVFAEDDDYVGLALTVEIRSQEEAEAVRAALEGVWPTKETAHG